MRRVSTRTTPPTAPRTSSSHMNQNRSCPGVPNRYRTMSGPIEMRPKSIATVVPVLFTPPGLSMPRLWTVISASVFNGSISEMAPTKVVLPTAKPPATTIFIATGTIPDGRGGESPRPARSKSADSIEQPLQERDVGGGVGCRRGSDHDGAGGGQVTDEDADHSHRQEQARRDLGDRQGTLAELDDATRLGRAPRVELLGLQPRLDRGFQGERRTGRLRPALRDHVGTDEARGARVRRSRVAVHVTWATRSGAP